MNLKKCLMLFLLSFLLLPESYSYEKPCIINIYRDKYKAANKNWSVSYDERGVMYFGNDIGLLEFDGIGWKLNRSINSSYIKGVGVKSHQTIYTGGFEDFGRWDRDISGTLAYASLRNLLPKNELNNETIWKVFLDKGKVYYQSFKCIYVYDGHSIKKIGSDKGFLFLYKIRDEYWVQQIYGALYRLHNDRLVKAQGSDFLKEKLARVILPFQSDKYLIGTASGEIYVYDGREKFTLWNPGFIKELRGKELNCAIYVPRRGSYYWGTLLDGVYETDGAGNIIGHYSSKNSLQNNTVLSLCKDKLDNVWIGMDRGLAYVRYTEGLSYYNTFNQDIGAVYCASFWNNYLLIGTNQGVYYMPKKDLNSPNAFASLRLINGTQGQVWSFSEIGGHLYCGHNMNVKEIGKDLSVSTPYLLNTGVFHVLELPVKNGRFLLADTYNKLVVINMDTGAAWTINDIPEPVINAQVDHLNNIWLETASRGVYKCRFADDLKTFHYRFYYGSERDKELPEKLSLFKVGERILLIGNNKFWTYDENRDKIVPEIRLNKCFSGIGDIKKVIHINGDQSWVVTASSIYRFAYDGYIARILESYNVDNDNLSLVNANENISVLNDSISLVCLDAGFILHNLFKKNKEFIKLGTPFLESVRISTSAGKARYLDINRASKVPYNFNNVNIAFTESDAFTSHLSVQYILEGVHDGWSAPAKIGDVYYARLPKGKYTFKIRSTDGLGNQSDTVSYPFEILPPWYQTIWAYACYAAGIIGIFYLARMLILRRYHNLRLQKLRMRQAQYLSMMNEKLLDKIEEKDAELFTQTSFIIRKNELILKLKDMLNDFCGKNTQRALLPLYQKMNALLSSNMDTEDDWKMFLIKFEEKHKNFFKKLKVMHPQLTNNDLRLCACLKLNLDSKNIASLMNISVRAVENNRYRLRKKLDIKSSQNLNEYFMNIE